MYSVADYGRMLADRVRVDAYRRALAAVVRPGSIVVDLGAGTGFFSLEACRLGAAKVYAIEPNDAVTLLPELARRNGFADRIEVLHKPSTEVVLETKADVVVADLRGVVPLYEANVAVVADARARLLADGGVLVPQKDVLEAALVEAPALYATLVGGWEGHPFDLGPARDVCANTYHHDTRHPTKPEQLLTPGRAWAEIRYGEPAAPLTTGAIDVAATRDGTAHGVVVWFTATLHDGIGFTTAPGSDRVYARAFLPLAAPAEVRAGDRVELELSARRGGGDHVWAWTTRVSRGSAIVAEHRQTTFLGAVASARALLKESRDYRPALDARGRAVAAMLRAMDGATPLAAIGRAAHAAHPDAFASEDEAIELAKSLAKTYG
jgi:protein arginine N-methyltransferase 1